MSKIPDLTPELEKRFEENTEELIALGAKGWARKRKKAAVMTEVEQDETVKRIDSKVREGG